MATIPADWQTELDKRGFGSVEVKKLLDVAYNPVQGVVYPPRAQVFRAFELSKLARVRVVVLGQDPYYAHPGQAHGLAFSVPDLGPSVPRSIRIPPALSSIFRNLEVGAANDPLSPFTRPANGDLSAWASRGVLLLNVALTVVAGEKASHLKLWQEFTAAVLDVLSDTGRPIAVMLWGGPAQAYASAVKPPAEVFPMPHPAYRPLKGQRNVWRSGLRLPFTAVNSFLVRNGRRAVDWRLI